MNINQLAATLHDFSNTITGHGLTCDQIGKHRIIFALADANRIAIMNANHRPVGVKSGRQILIQIDDQHFQTLEEGLI